MFSNEGKMENKHNNKLEKDLEHEYYFYEDDQKIEGPIQRLVSRWDFRYDLIYKLAYVGAKAMGKNSQKDSKKHILVIHTDKDVNQILKPVVDAVYHSFGGLSKKIGGIEWLSDLHYFNALYQNYGFFRNRYGLIFLSTNQLLQNEKEKHKGEFAETICEAIKWSYGPADIPVVIFADSNSEKLDDKILKYIGVDKQLVYTDIYEGSHRKCINRVYEEMINELWNKENNGSETTSLLELVPDQLDNISIPLGVNDLNWHYCLNKNIVYHLVHLSASALNNTFFNDKRKKILVIHGAEDKNIILNPLIEATYGRSLITSQNTVDWVGDLEYLVPILGAAKGKFFENQYGLVVASLDIPLCGKPSAHRGERLINLAHTLRKFSKVPIIAVAYKESDKLEDGILKWAGINEQIIFTEAFQKWDKSYYGYAAVYQQYAEIIAKYLPDID